MLAMHHATSSRRAPKAALAAILGCAAIASCSAISRVDYEECSEGATCRDAFGLGYTCGSAGLCEKTEVVERCKTVFPVDLLKSPDKYSDVVLFGSLFDLTTKTGDGKLIKAANLAIEEANKTGLAEGRLFGIVHCDYQENASIDDQTSEEAALQGTKYLADQLGAVAIIGPGTSGLAEAVYKELQKPEHTNRPVIISPSATSPSLTATDTDKPGMFWRTAPPDSVLGAQLASYMEDEIITNAVVVYESSSYGKGLADELDKNYEDSLTRMEYQDPSTLGSLVNKIASDNPTPDNFAVVFITSEVDQVTAFLSAAGSLMSGYYSGPEVKIFLGDTALNEDVLTATQAIASEVYPNVRGVFPGAPMGDTYNAFIASYAAKYNEQASDASYSAYTYDATWLAIYGSAWSYYQHDKTLEGRFIAEGLRHISSGDPFSVGQLGWPSVRDAFSKKKDINIIGASGALDYDPATEETTAPVVRWTIVPDGAGGFDFETQS